MNLTALKDQPRLLLEAKLKPVRAAAPTHWIPRPRSRHLRWPRRHQDAPRRVPRRDTANRLESVCWDTVNNNWVAPLKGLPAVLVSDKDGKPLTNSVMEAHRLNSAYIATAEGFDEIKKAVAFDATRPLNLGSLVKALLKYDPNSLLHGIFLEKIAGVIRLPRALTGFIEAKEVTTVASGGVKNDRVKAGTEEGKTAKEGFGNVPFHREEFTGEITAFFNLDLALIRGFGLGEDVEALLIAIALFKIQRFLRDGLRLRTACDLDLVGELQITRPKDGFTMPTLAELETALPAMIEKAFGGKSDERFTTVTFKD